MVYLGDFNVLTFVDGSDEMRVTVLLKEDEKLSKEERQTLQDAFVQFRDKVSELKYLVTVINMQPHTRDNEHTYTTLGRKMVG